jgi:alpha-ketoglutarate-dependent 2,4-dichlorophenoxyacetate dioxygenase
MPVTVKPLHPLIGAEISGFDMRRPVDAATLKEIVAAMDRWAVGVFRNPAPLSDEQHIAFSRQLGPIQKSEVLMVEGRKPRLPYGEIIDQSNLDHRGEIFAQNDKQLLYKRANQLWHTDMSFHPVRATYSLLSAHLIPPGGADTEFADMRAAYDALPGAMKAKLEGLVAEHSYWHSRVVAGGPEPTAAERNSRPPARHPLVHVHPGSKRKALYLASHASNIVGWPVKEGQALLRELTELATQPQFIYRHVWQLGDVVAWDNLCTMHRATPFEDTTHRRDMRRTTVREAEVA